VEHPHAFDAVYDPHRVRTGVSYRDHGPADRGARGACSRRRPPRRGSTARRTSVSLWGLMHGLGTLAAAGHFTLDDALSAYAASLTR
ncbi:TetR/AcrR family transcriptional regulator, partial [Microbacterium sp. NRRL B-14842]